VTEKKLVKLATFFIAILLLVQYKTDFMAETS